MSLLLIIIIIISFPSFLKWVSVAWGFNEIWGVSIVFWVGKTFEVSLGDREDIAKNLFMVKLIGWADTWKELGDIMSDQNGDVQAFTGEKDRTEE